MEHDQAPAPASDLRSPADDHLDTLCAICEQEPATVDAILDDKPVSVCAACFAYETGEGDAA
jgi:hypothetical protein